MIEKWEYWTGYLHASITNAGVRDFLRKTMPDWANPPKFTPEAMIPDLNMMGDQGWELVHMQPVVVAGSDGDIFFPAGAPAWSHAYFCVFKRRVEPQPPAAEGARGATTTKTSSVR